MEDYKIIPIRFELNSGKSKEEHSIFNLQLVTEREEDLLKFPEEEEKLKWDFGNRPEELPEGYRFSFDYINCYSQKYKNFRPISVSISSYIGSAIGKPRHYYCRLYCPPFEITKDDYSFKSSSLTNSMINHRLCVNISPEISKEEDGMLDVLDFTTRIENLDILSDAVITFVKKYLVPERFFLLFDNASASFGGQDAMDKIINTLAKEIPIKYGNSIFDLRENKEMYDKK